VGHASRWREAIEVLVALFGDERIDAASELEKSGVVALLLGKEVGEGRRGETLATCPARSRGPAW
jgi:hypothetical protein